MSATSTSGGSRTPRYMALPADAGSQRGLWIWSAALLAAMMACLAISMVQLGQLLSPGWTGTYLVVLSFLVSLESILSWRNMGRRHFPDRSWFIYIGTELLLILLAIKLAQYATYGFGLFLLDLQRWSRDFGSYFFDGETMAAMGVLFVVWLFSRQMAGNLALLDVDAQTLALEEESGISEARHAARERLAAKILWLGAIITLVVSLMHVDVLAAWFYLPVLRAGVYNLLVYFLLGLVLLSLTQYLTLRVEWLRQQLPIPAGLPTRWVLYSLVFIGLVVLVASQLPTRYSLGLLETLHYVMDVFGIALQFLVALLLVPIYLLTWLLELLFGHSESGPPPASQPTPPLFEQPHTPIPWLELLRTILFWVLLVGTIIGGLMYYLRDRRYLLAGMRRNRLVVLLGNFWSWLTAAWRSASCRAAGSAAQGWRRIRSRWQARPAQPPGGWLNLRRLSPRQRVFFYYLTLLRRSAEQGLPRRPGQTPYEYMSELIKIAHLPPVEAERGIIVDNADPAQVSGLNTGSLDQEGLEQSIRSLTEQFVEARYSPHTISPHQASLAQRCWETIRRFLRRPKKLR